MDKGTVLFTVFALLVLAVGGALAALFWTELQGTGDNADNLSTTIRNVMLMLGAFLALPLAIWRGWVAERQVNATQESVGATNRAIASQRFQAAAQMLGDQVNAVRLGAMQTLVSLARDDPEQYYIPSMRLLAAFVRDPTRGEGVQQPTTKPELGKSVREDVSYALSVIGSRTSDDLDLERSEGFTIDLEGVRLIEVDLRDLNLSRVRLRHANLAKALCQRADFSGSDLSSALMSDADLEGANFRAAILTNTDFSTRYRSAFAISGSKREKELSPANGLVQSQLDHAIADVDNPPILQGVVDAVTGQPLSWRGEAAR